MHTVQTRSQANDTFTYVLETNRRKIIGLIMCVKHKMYSCRSCHEEIYMLGAFSDRLTLSGHSASGLRKFNG